MTTDESQLSIAGQGEFDRARMRAFWDEMVSFLRGKPVELLSFDDIKARLKLGEQSYRGLQNVPLDRIVGSVGRYHDFTRTFLPKKKEMRDRWSRIYSQVSGMQGLPPVDLYQVDDVYFVRDGNHRVSVARQMGAKSIEAYVTQVHTPVDLEPNMTRKQLDAATAYADFLEATKLNLTRPQHEPIQLSEPSRYTEVLDHIRVTQRVMEHRYGREVKFQDAAARWYDVVFAPAAALIRKYDVLRYAEDRTVADFYVWLVSHFNQIRSEHADDVGRRYKVSEILVDYLEERGIAVPDELRTEVDDSIIE